MFQSFYIVFNCVKSKTSYLYLSWTKKLFKYSYIFDSNEFRHGCIPGLGFCPQFYSSFNILRLLKPMYTWPQLHSLHDQHKVSRCPPCPRTAIWFPAGGQATHTHPGHQLFSIIASQWLKLINIQTGWLWMLHPCAAAGCVHKARL